MFLFVAAMSAPRCPVAATPPSSRCATCWPATWPTAPTPGASVAVVHDGELVADLWGGEARPGEPWVEDTVVQVWSVAKTMAALTTLVLADRGELDLDAPVSSYWKEFRRDDVLVRHLLSHTSGYAGWTEPLRRGRAARPRAVRADAGRAGAVVGARDGVRLPHGQLRPPARRAGAGRHRRAAGRPVPDARRRAARRRLPPRRARGRAGALRRPAAADRVLARPRRAPRGQLPGADDREPDPRRREPLQHRRVAAGVGGRRQRPRQRPRDRPRAVGGLARRRGGRRTAALAGDGRPDLRGAGRRPRPGAVRPADVGHRLRAAAAVSAPAVPDGPGLLVDRLGRLDRGQRPRPPGHRRLRDEPDGRPLHVVAAHRRLRAHGVRVPGGS